MKFTLKNILAIVFLFVLWNIGGSYAYTERITSIQSYGKTETCFIVGIDDGDTFNLDCIGWYYLNVRLLGINTPDYNVLTWKRSCYYNESKRYIMERKKRTYTAVFYWKDLCKDEYKWCRNLVRLIDTKSKIDLAQMMILRWYAFSWTLFSAVPDNIKYIYKSMEQIASENKIGLWNECNINYNSNSPSDSGIPDKMTQIID